MTGFLSIIWRELAVGARQRATYRSRLIIGGLALAAFLAFLLVHNEPPNVIGPRLFGIISTLLFVQAILLGVRLTSDCLSEEKREGTLGLLFLTEMRAGEVVMAKMCVRSLRGLYAMLATLPVFSFCILMGGVRGIEPLYISLALLSTMIFSLAVGVFVSSRSTDDRSAFLGTFGLLAAFVFLPLLLWKILSDLTSRAPWCDLLLYASPGYAFFSAAPSIAMPWEFSKCLAFQFVCAGGLLAAATHQLRQSFLHQFALSAKPEAPATVEPFRSYRNQRGTQRGLLNANPFLWLLQQETFMPKLMRGFVAVAVAVGLIGGSIVHSSRGGNVSVIVIFTIYGLHVAWKILLTADALRQLHHDHRSGALELLLSTPIPVEEMLEAQLTRTRRLFRPAAIALCFGSALIFIQKNLIELPMLPIAGALLLFIDARALSWRAMLRALRPGRFPGAVLRAAGIVLVPPVVCLILTVFAFRGFSSQAGNVFFFCYLLACALYDFILASRAKKVLKEEFRLLATRTAVLVPNQTPRLPKPLRWLFLHEPVPSV